MTDRSDVNRLWRKFEAGEPIRLDEMVRLLVGPMPAGRKPADEGGGAGLRPEDADRGE